MRDFLQLVAKRAQEQISVNCSWRFSSSFLYSRASCYHAWLPTAL